MYYSKIRDSKINYMNGDLSKLQNYIYRSVRLMEDEKDRLNEENRIIRGKCLEENHQIIRNHDRIDQLRDMIRKGYTWIEKLGKINGKEADNV